MKRALLFPSLLLMTVSLLGLPPSTLAKTTRHYYTRTVTTTTRRYSTPVRTRTIRTTRTTRFVRTRFALRGRVMHDTNLIRRSIILMGNDGIRRRIDVPAGTRVVDDRNGKGISIHKIHNGDFIRISGVQTDVKRWRANRIELLAKG